VRDFSVALNFSKAAVLGGGEWDGEEGGKEVESWSWCFFQLSSNLHMNSLAVVQIMFFVAAEQKSLLTNG